MRNKSGAAYAATKYIEFTVKTSQPLMEFLMTAMQGISRNKVKAILSGHGISVDKKLVTQYDFLLQPGMVVRVSRHKRSTELKNKFIKLVYEDKDLVVIEKNIPFKSPVSLYEFIANIDTKVVNKKINSYIRVFLFVIIYLVPSNFNLYYYFIYL